MVTIAREGLEDKYSLQLNPGGGQGLGHRGGEREKREKRSPTLGEVGLVQARIFLVPRLRIQGRGRGFPR